jgi:hypothetical protein
MQSERAKLIFFGIKLSGGRQVEVGENTKLFHFFEFSDVEDREEEILFEE